MLITAVILLLAILLPPILLIRFRKRPGSSLQLGGYDPNHEPIRRPIVQLRHPYACRSEVRHGLPDASECFSSAGGVPDCAHLWTGSEWVRNVIVAGGCQLGTRCVQYQLSAPTIVHDPTLRRFPLFVRMMLGIIGANDFMQLRTSYAIRGVAS
jgi:hypothetical protein